jgi:1,4-dihydroxy-2-naphthoate octaprenyltransferase
VNYTWQNLSNWLDGSLVFLAAMLIIGLLGLTIRLATLYVIGRFRYFFGQLGEFFRLYFFSMDREELPFNRAQRS